MARASLLIIDDEPNILSTLRRALELEDYRVEVAGGGKVGLEKVMALDIDLVLVDMVMPEMDGLAVLAQVAEAKKEVVTVMMSGNATVDTAVKATKLGAYDFVEKPLSTDKLLITIENALALRNARRERDQLKSHASAQFAMVGGGASMRRIFDKIEKTAPSSGRVLITGENGTGKELVARAVHENSKRAQGPFIKLNCAAIPGELIESELFGHEKGAFTGATQQRRGKFELADKGTLFLDEIGDMTPSAQAKVLRVLQEGEFERVGGDATIKTDVRVVAATNKDLKKEIEEGRFREDLFYRLNVVPIELPPLRSRKEDIPDLVNYFLKAFAEEEGTTGEPKHLANKAMSLLIQHDWPGNVRELKNAIERLGILTGEKKLIDDQDVSETLPGVKKVRSNYQRGTSLKDLVATAERELILEALAANSYHVSNTAKELSLERSHLYKKMKALGIQSRSGSGSDEGA